MKSLRKMKPKKMPEWDVGKFASDVETGAGRVRPWRAVGGSEAERQ
jgi:hypothetical protein